MQSILYNRFVNVVLGRPQQKHTQSEVKCPFQHDQRCLRVGLEVHFIDTRLTLGVEIVAHPTKPGQIFSGLWRHAQQLLLTCWKNVLKGAKLRYFEWSPPWHVKTAMLTPSSLGMCQVRFDIRFYVSLISSSSSLLPPLPLPPHRLHYCNHLRLTVPCRTSRPVTLNFTYWL